MSTEVRQRRKSFGRYEGDYRCEMGQDPETHCPRIATQVWAEPYTPRAFAILTCDECAESLRGFGYRFDSEATQKLAQDVAEEAALNDIDEVLILRAEEDGTA